MASMVLGTLGTALNFAATGGDVTFTTTSLAAGAGKISDSYAVPSSSGRLFSFRAKAKWASAPTINDYVDVYLIRSDGSTVDGGFTLGDDDLTVDDALEAQLRSCQKICQIKAFAASTAQMSHSGYIWIAEGTIGVIYVNRSAVALSSTASENEFVLTPVEDNISTLETIGTKFIVKKTLTSSAIVTGGVAVTGASSGGELQLEQIILKTDGTGLAAATNVNFTTDNAKGVSLLAAEAVANLGANDTVIATAASVTPLVPTVLESGTTITAVATGTNATGAGTIDIYLVLTRLAASATVAAA